MDIDVIDRISKEHVLEHIRWTPLSHIEGIASDEEARQLQRKGSDGIKDRCVFPYRDAEIKIVLMDPNEIQPTSFYELKRGKEKQAELRQALLEKHGIDPLLIGQHDFGGMIVRHQGVDYTIIPAICEYPLNERYGRLDRLLGNDCVHRAKLAMELGVKLSVVSIKGANVPFYALANPEGWRQNMIVDEVPMIKKAYSCSNPYSLYRNFDHGFVLPKHYDLERVMISEPR